MLWLATSAAPLDAADLDAARALHRAGELDAALQAYADIIDAAAAPPAEVAVAHNNSCVILLDRGDFHGAYPYCQRAVALSRAGDGSAPLARALNNLGLASQNLGDFAGAGAAYREALELNRASGDLAAEAINLTNLGWLATQTAQYSRAMALQESVMALARAHPDASWSTRQLQVAQLNQGVTLERLGAYRQALDLYRELLEQGPSMPAVHRVALQVNLGVVYRNLGDPVSALAIFEQARDVYRDLGDQAGLTNVFLNMGLVQDLNLHRPDAAREAYENALRLARDSGDTEQAVQALCFLGHLLLGQAVWGDAQLRFGEALALAAGSEAGEGTWNALYGLARVAMARGRPEDALQLLEEAMLSIESIRSRLERGRLRAGFFGDRRSVYALAVDALAATPGPPGTVATRAFEVVQRAKARELLDALGTDTGRHGPAALDDLQRRLGDRVLIEFFDAGEDVYRFTLTREGLRMRAAGSGPRLTARVGEVYDALSRRRTVSAEMLETLSRDLFGDDLDGVTDGVWVAPDRALHYLPFELLPKTTPGGAPLVASTTVAYLPSASFLPRREADTSPEKPFVGFGDPVLRGDGATDRDPRRLLTAEFGLDPLPQSGRELRDMASLLTGARAEAADGQGEIHLGPEATEAAFRESVAGGARVVHLATHTLIDNRAPRGAAVMLTADDYDDGLLYPEEIAGLDYRSSLTVLATCRSAFGSEVDGFGLGTLSGALLAAGSDSVLVTLWDVGDAATATFMRQFYHYLGRGETPSAALRLAKNRLRQHPEWSDPGLWAGYVLIGDSPPIRRPSPGVVPIALVCAALVLSAWLYRKRIRSASKASVRT